MVTIRMATRKKLKRLNLCFGLESFTDVFERSLRTYRAKATKTRAALDVRGSRQKQSCEKKNQDCGLSAKKSVLSPRRTRKRTPLPFRMPAIDLRYSSTLSNRFAIDLQDDIAAADPGFVGRASALDIRYDDTFCFVEPEALRDLRGHALHRHAELALFRHRGDDFLQHM